MHRYALIAASTLALTSQALAQTADATAADELKKQKEAIELQKDLINARKDLVAAESALVTARMDALGLKPAEGTTTLEDGAGQIEAQMLAVGAMAKAAQKIKDDIGVGPFLLLDGNQAIDLTLAQGIKADLKILDAAVDLARVDPTCTPNDDRLAITGALPLIGAALSLLRTDTVIRGITITPSASQLRNAVAAKLGSEAIVMDDLANPDFAKSELLTALDAQTERLQEAAGCSAVLAQGDAASKAKAVVLDAAIKQATDFRAAITKSDGTSPSKLSMAIKFEAVAKDNLKLLRLYTEALGGSLLKRGNVWTALGAPAVGLTSGLVISYRLSDPAKGRVEKSGVLVCRTALTNMREIHAGRVRASDCGVTITRP
ncbi:hypothetical protein [Sandarakinorhabdus sp.]|uniref:hypothetical protein n=1 Tax=Sandarakinorhabdus sp. TaxID=1916663 RepID=UPI0028A71A09|nr:hypothetical protein [Sandarakinorhabdus sp.]